MSSLPDGPWPPNASRQPRPATLRLRRLADALTVLLDHPDLGSDEIATFVALARYCDADGRCHPSQTTLATHLHRSRPWINARIATLCALGILEKTQHFLPKGGQTSCRYRIPSLAAALPASNWVDGQTGTTSRQGLATDTACHRDDTMNLESLEQTNLSLCAPAREELDGGLLETGDWVVGEPTAPVQDRRVQDAPSAPADPRTSPLPGQPSPRTRAVAATKGEGIASPLGGFSAAPSCPSPWKPSAVDFAWAAVRRPDIDLAAFTEKFLKKTTSDHSDHHSNQPAEAWSRRWRNWLIDERLPRYTGPSMPTARRLQSAGEASDRPAEPRTTPSVAAAPEDMLARASRLGAALASRLRTSPMEAVQ